MGVNCCPGRAAQHLISLLQYKILLTIGGGKGDVYTRPSPLPSRSARIDRTAHQDGIRAATDQLILKNEVMRMLIVPPSVEYIQHADPDKTTIRCQRLPGWAAPGADGDFVNRVDDDAHRGGVAGIIPSEAA